jgi:hypothetical protein
MIHGLIVILRAYNERNYTPLTYFIYYDVCSLELVLKVAIFCVIIQNADNGHYLVWTYEMITYDTIP